MTGIMLKSVLLTAILLNDFFSEAPKGWIKAGSDPSKFEAGVVQDPVKKDNKVAYLKSVSDTVNGFGTLMQQFKADRYKGKRLKMTGRVRSQVLSDWAGLWLRIDQSNSSTPLAFDNMSSRPIKGSTGWTSYEIVLDVPGNSATIAFGILMAGTGELWLDDIAFSIVGNKVATTVQVTSSKGNELPVQPVNLSFD